MTGYHTAEKVVRTTRRQITVLFDPPIEIVAPGRNGVVRGFTYTDIDNEGTPPTRPYMLWPLATQMRTDGKQPRNRPTTGFNADARRIVNRWIEEHPAWWQVTQ